MPYRRTTFLLVLQQRSGIALTWQIGAANRLAGKCVPGQTRRDTVSRKTNVEGKKDVAAKQKTLDQLAKLICKEHERAAEGLHEGLIHAIKCGEYLREAKTQTQHGGWEKWVRESFLNKYKLAARTERKYRWFAKNQALLPAKWQHTASFSWQDAERAIRKKGGKDDDPVKAKKKEKAAPEEKPQTPPLPPKPTAKHLETASTLLGEKGIDADPQTLLSVLEELDVNIGRLLKKLEQIASENENAERKTWLASHEDWRKQWNAVCESFGVFPDGIAYAAYRATKGTIEVWAENESKTERPNEDWSRLIASDFQYWPPHHFFVKENFDAEKAARAGAEWLLEHCDAYEIHVDKPAIRKALAAQQPPAHAATRPTIKHLPAAEPPIAASAKPQTLPESEPPSAPAALDFADLRPPIEFESETDRADSPDEPPSTTSRTER